MYPYLPYNQENFNKKMKDIKVINLGQVDFDQAIDLQMAARNELLNGKGNPVIYILEHNPTVITIGRHGNSDNIITTEKALSEENVQIRHISRGGDVTVHEKGQMVIYFVLPLPSKSAGRLSMILLETLRDFILHQFNLKLSIISKKPGLWYQDKKISAIGLDATSGVTMHGISLNVNNDLRGFSLIKPCGMDTEITTLERITETAIDMKFILKEAANFYQTVGFKKIMKMLESR